MAPLPKDIQFTAQFLALLRAGALSRVALEGAANRLELAVLPANYAEKAYSDLEKLEGWVKDLEEGLPIFSLSWSYLETFDAISAMDLMKNFKEDLLWFAPIVSKALQAPKLEDDIQATKILAAGIARCATMRLSTSETLHNLYIKLKDSDSAQQSYAEIPDSVGYVQTANTIVDIFGDEHSYTNELCERLRAETSLVSCDLMATAHETRILLNVFAKNFSFELAEIDPREARKWAAKNIPAVAAGFWYAYHFSPDDYFRWLSVGIRGAPLAAYWRRANFEPEEAVKWIQHGLPPSIAETWARAGYDPERAILHLQKGINQPGRASHNDEDK